MPMTPEETTARGDLFGCLVVVLILGGVALLGAWLFFSILMSML